MPDHLKHLTIDQVRRISDLSDAVHTEWRESSLKGLRVRPEETDSAMGMIYALNMLECSDQRDAYIELIALTWVGRGDIAPRDFEATVAERRDQHFNVDYLVKKSPIRVHLETGLWALGYLSSTKTEWMDEYVRMRRTYRDPDYPPLFDDQPGKQVGQ